MPLNAETEIRNTLHKLLNRILHNLDLISAILVFFISIGLIFISILRNSFELTEIGIMTFLASSFYFVVRITKNQVLINTTDILKSRQIGHTSKFIVFFICFILLFIFSTYYLHMLLRPQEYFIIIAVMSTIILGEIIFSDKSIYKYIIIIQILLLGLNIRAGLFFEYPGYYGGDPWAHIGVISGWMDIGHIMIIQSASASIQYFSYPLFHLTVIISQILTNVSLKNALFVSIGIEFIFSILFIYLFCKPLIGEKNSLIATLFMAIISFHIWWGAWIIPTTVGIIYVSLTLYLIFYKELTRERFILLTIIFVSLVLTHPLSTFVLIFVLFTLYLSNILFKKILQWTSFSKLISSKTTINFSLGIPLLLVVLTLFYWIITKSSSRDTFSYLLNPFLEQLNVEAQVMSTPIEVSHYYLAQIGFLLLAFLILLGIFCWLNEIEINSTRFSVIASFTLMVVLIYSLGSFGIDSIIPSRWFVFITVISVPLAAQGLVIFSGLSNNIHVKIFISFFMIFCLTFFMINSGLVNPHTPFYGKLSDDPSRNALTESELSAIEKITQIYSGDIVSDPYILDVSEDPNLLFNSHVTVNPVNEGMYLIRSYIFTHKSDWKKNFPLESITNKLENTQNNLIYSNYYVKCYLL